VPRHVQCLESADRGAVLPRHRGDQLVSGLLLRLHLLDKLRCAQVPPGVRPYLGSSGRCRCWWQI
jgi:hypothetical protein